MYINMGEDKVCIDTVGACLTILTYGRRVYIYIYICLGIYYSNTHIMTTKLVMF